MRAPFLRSIPEGGGLPGSGFANRSLRTAVLFAALVFALLGETVAAFAAAASWAAASRVAGANPTRRLDAVPGLPSPEHAGVRGPGVDFSLAACLAAIFAVFLVLLLGVELVRSGFPGRSAFLDSLRSALACTALLVPLGFPLASALLPDRARDTASRKILAFQLSCCMGMSLAEFGAILAGWVTPLSMAQMLWANLAGTALPTLALASAPESSDPPESIPGRLPRPPFLPAVFLIRGPALAAILVSVYRLGLGSAAGVPLAAARARSLAFLSLCLIQSLEPLRGIRRVSRTGCLRGSLPGWVVRLCGTLGVLALTAGLFFLAPLRSGLGLQVPTLGALGTAAAAAAFAACGMAVEQVFRRTGRA